MKVRSKKTVIGTAKCLCCEREIPVKRNELGTLDHSCMWCDLPMYAKEGTEAHRRLMGRVTLFAAGPVDTGPADEVPPTKNVPVHVAPVPARAAVRGVFDLLAGRE